MLFFLSVMCLGELLFYPHEKKNVFGRVINNMFEQVWYNALWQTENIENGLKNVF